MNKIAVMPVYKRADYLKRTLSSLHKQGDVLDGWRFLFHVEPDCEASVNTIKDFLEVHDGDLVVHTTHKGCDKNICESLGAAFDAGADAVLRLQDDEIHGSDSVALADWFLALENLSDYALLFLNNIAPSADAPLLLPDTILETMGREAYPNDAGEIQWRPCANVLTRAAWEGCFRDLWLPPNGGALETPIVDGWRAWGRPALVPAVSRARHIGEHGTHCYPAWFAIHNAHEVVYTGPPVSEFIISGG